MQGDTLWGKVYLLDGRSHEPILEDNIVYADWISPEGELLESYYLKSQYGQATFDIVLDINAPPGDYTLKVYTLYQLNFDPGLLFQKKIKVAGYEEVLAQNTVGKDFEMQFFPEGGYLVNGLESRVAFKAVDSNGNNIEIQGEILDENNNLVTSFKTLEKGLGTFYLTPKVGQRYKAESSYNGIRRSFELPDAIRKGFVMTVNTVQEDQVSFSISSNDKATLKDCYLIGQQNGEIFLDQNLKANKVLLLKLDKASLPFGLLHFTLFNDEHRPISERLVFNTKNEDTVQVDIQLDKSSYPQKQRGIASIKSSDFSSYYRANLSISIYNTQYTEGNHDESLDIRNYLNLQSELRGKIKNINKYFKKDDKQARAMLDLLLMTHGWSRYTWQEIMDNKFKELSYPKESTFTLSGQVMKARKNEPVKANVLFNILDQKDFAFANIETGSDGVFHIPDLGIQDSTNIFLQASIYNKKDKKQVNEDEIKKVGDSDVDISLIELNEFTFDADLGIPYDELEIEKEEIVKAQIKDIVNSKLGLENIDSSLWSLSIDEVTVTEKKLSARRQRLKQVKRKYRDRKIFYLGTTEKFFAEDLYKYEDKFDDVYDMLSSAIPMTYVKGPRGNRQLMKMGNEGKFYELNIALNGDLVSANYLDFIDPEQVEIIELVFGPTCEPLFFECPVVRVVTKSKSPLLDAKFATLKRGSLSIAHPGFYKTKAYYKRMYEDDIFDDSPDERVTLLWNPNLELKGEDISIDFTTGDLEGEHIIAIEGISEDGIPVVAFKKFFVGSK